ncbi:MAG: sodium:solute symporter [Peptococcaceae bacterium]|nr:sodium:solute symporter [Peptococcaceae bacterium]
MVIKAGLLLIFFAVTIFVGFYFRKRASNVSGFVLGGRDVGPWLTAFAFGASYFSAVVFVGYAGQFGWRFGTAAVWIGLANAFIGSLMAWFVLGRRTRVMTNHLKSATMPEFFGSRYGSVPLKIGASIIVFVFLIPYTASLYNGLSRLFSMAFSVPFEWCILAMGLLTAVFVVAGGYFATAVNDFIQGMVMLLGIVAVIAVVLNDNGGFTAAINSLAHVSDPAAGSAPGVFTSFFGPDLVSLLGVIILTSLGTWGLPQMVSRFYAIKSESMITKGAIVSTIFALVVAGGCYFLGSFGRLYAGAEGIAFNANGGIIYDSIIPTILSGFPEILIGVVVVLVFAASISTLSSLVMASASTLTLDFLKGHVIKEMNEKRQLLSIRVLIVVFIAISSVIAIFQYSGGITFIAQLMGISWGALAGSFLAPFLYGLYWKRVSKISVWCCFLFSTTLMISNVFLGKDYFPAVLKSPINCGALAMLAGLVIVPVVSWLTKVHDKKAVEECFSCYEQTVVVKVSEDLG